jgi:hypothetical protein
MVNKKVKVKGLEHEKKMMLYKAISVIIQTDYPGWIQ